MNEHEKHTEFLRQCVLYDESARRQNLVKEIAWIQRDLRCVRRAMWLMAFLAALVVAVLGYAKILVRNFPYNESQFTVNLVFALGVGFLISLLAFASLWIVYRWKLDLRREECRQMVTKLLESRLGKPARTLLPANSGGEENALPKLTEAAMENFTGELDSGSEL